METDKYKIFENRIKDSKSEKLNLEIISKKQRN